MSNELMTYADLWRKLKAYRPDWFDTLVVAPGVIGLCVANSWYAGWTVRSMLIGPLSAAIGWLAVTVLYPLWFRR
jgi:hypothetical protein